MSAPESPETITSAKLAKVAGVRHAFFTRKGGVSTGIYDSLNVGRGSKDDPAAVAENRRRCAEAMGVDAGALLTCYQTHSTMVRVADALWGDERPEGDAIVTTVRGLACSALAADCAPVLMADPEARVIASVHAGWKGALDGVVGSAVAAMQAAGAQPRRIVAAVGPCIGPDSYEVGLEFVERFSAHDPGCEQFFTPGALQDKRMFDLPGFVLWRLEHAGVGEAEWVALDTCAEADRFFSNRRAFRAGEPDYGRLLSAIALV
jgi:YfiH family protein